jgi:hypothetical protein
LCGGRGRKISWGDRVRKDKKWYERVYERKLSLGERVRRSEETYQAVINPIRISFAEVSQIPL